MNNAERMARITGLVADISSCQIDAKSHQENFQNVSNLAYGALQDTLKAKGMKTTDELVKEVIKELTPQEQQKILDHLKELTPPTGLEYFLQPSELAKFIFFSYLISGVKTVVAPYFFKAKAWYISARSNAVLQATRAGAGLVGPEATLAKMSQAERQGILDALKAEQRAVEEQLADLYNVEIPAEEKVFQSVEEIQETLLNIEKSAAAVEKVGAAEADAIAAASKISLWTKVFIVINVAAIAGLYIYDKVKENQIAEELHEVIAKVATARLYARMSEKMELTHTDQMSTIQMLAQAYADNDQQAQAFLKKNFTKVVDQALKGITEESTYKILAEQDHERGADTREDPSLEDMKKRKQEEAKKPLAK